MLIGSKTIRCILILSKTYKAISLNRVTKKSTIIDRQTTLQVEICLQIQNLIKTLNLMITNQKHQQLQKLDFGINYTIQLKM